MAKNATSNTPLEDLSSSKIAKAAKAAKPMKMGDLTGTWIACDKATRGIVRVVLRKRGNGLVVRVYGACHPKPCNWGSVPGFAYAESVVATRAIAFSAVYKPSFKRTIVTGHLDNGTLIVETYSRFTDGSGRSNYYSRSYFCKLKRWSKK